MKILKKMKSLYTIGHWKRVPVQLHWSILLILPWYYLRTWSLTQAVVAMMAYAMLILIHELGHAIVAHWRGLGVYGITLYLFHGKCLVEVPYHEEDDVWVAWGGIAAQTCLLMLAAVMSYLLHPLSFDGQDLLKPLFVVLIPINVLTIVINLIPMQPLDGYKAWRVVPLFLAHRMSMKSSRPSREKKKFRVISGDKADAKKITADAIKKMMEK